LKRRRPLSRLLLANLAAIAALLLAVLGYTQSRAWAERGGLERLAELAVERLELYAGTLDAETARLAHLPALVAQHEEVLAVFDQPSSLAAAERRLAQINARAGSLLIYLVDEQGRWRAGSAALPLPLLERERLERVAAALRAGRTGFFAAQDGSTDFFHAMPLQQGERLLGQVVVRLNLAPLEATWVDLGVRSRSEKLIVVDANEVVILSSVPAWKHLRLVAGLDSARWPWMPPEEAQHYAPRPLGVLRWSEAVGAVRGAQLLRLDTPEGGSQQFLAQERPLPALGLRLLTLSDPAELRREAGRTAWGGAALGALIGLLASYYLYRRAALAQLLAARNALAQARDDLERQVQERTRELQDANSALQTQIAQRERAEDELVQAGKLAVLGQLSAGLAHELNQPLTALAALAGNTPRLMEAGRVDAVRRNLTAIESAVERMAKLTRQLKGFARRADGVLEVVSLAHAVGNALLLLEHRLREAEVKLDLQIPEGLALRCDGTRLEQVLVNLFANAIDAMAEAPTKRISVLAQRQGARVLIAIRDTGCGVNDAVRERLFEPFFTTKPAGQGLGLGLVISAQIVREFGSHLQPEPGPEGMCFRFDVEAVADEDDGDKNDV
jgi:two-component system C4-dicarboxylate transport sensor histidine kinase DctB